MDWLIYVSEDVRHMKL